MLQACPRFPARIRTIALAGALLTAGWLAGAAAAPADGPLTPEEKNAIVRALSDAGEPADNSDDPGLQAAVIRYAKVELGQRIRPSAVDRMWSVEPPQRLVNAEFADARAEGRLGPWLQSLSPSFEQYRNLRAARARYRALAAAGGWPHVNDTAELHEGERNAAIKTLRARLAAEG